MNLLSCRGAEDVELWFTEVENLLALEDVGKVCYFGKNNKTHTHNSLVVLWFLYLDMIIMNSEKSCF